MKKSLCILICASITAGCSVSHQAPRDIPKRGVFTPEEFSVKRRDLSLHQLCDSRASAIANRNSNYLIEIDAELRKRTVDGSYCAKLAREEAEEENREASKAADGFKTFLGLLALGAIAYAVSKNSGSSYSAPSFSPLITDHDWAWDQFYNEHNDLVWSCRGRQTGQFAELGRCNYKTQTDSTWPSKRADTR